MKIDIKAQDRTVPEAREVRLHPALWKRLDSKAAELNHSDPNYVLGQILEQVLPQEKAAKPVKAKVAKEAAGKAA